MKNFVAHHFRKKNTIELIHCFIIISAFELQDLQPLKEISNNVYKKSLLRSYNLNGVAGLPNLISIKKLLCKICYTYLLIEHISYIFSILHSTNFHKQYFSLKLIYTAVI